MKPHAPFYLGTMFADKRSRFLDVLNVETLKSAKATASFQLNCI